MAPGASVAQVVEPGVSMGSLTVTALSAVARVGGDDPIGDGRSHGEAAGGRLLVEGERSACRYSGILVVDGGLVAHRVRRRIAGDTVAELETPPALDSACVIVCSPATSLLLHQAQALLKARGRSIELRIVNNETSHLDVAEQFDGKAVIDFPTDCQCCRWCCRSSTTVRAGAGWNVLMIVQVATSPCTRATLLPATAGGAHRRHRNRLTRCSPKGLRFRLGYRCLH